MTVRRNYLILPLLSPWRGLPCAASSAGTDPQVLLWDAADCGSGMGYPLALLSMWRSDPWCLVSAGCSDSWPCTLCYVTYCNGWLPAQLLLAGLSYTEHRLRSRTLCGICSRSCRSITSLVDPCSLDVWPLHMLAWSSLSCTLLFFFYRRPPSKYYTGPGLRLWEFSYALKILFGQRLWCWTDCVMQSPMDLSVVL